MTLFNLKWLRRFVRRNTAAIPEDRALEWKRRLSIVYAVLAWNAFGFVCFMAYTGRSDWAAYYGYKTEEDMKLSQAQQFSKRLNTEKGTILKFKGFKKIDEIPFDNTNKDLDN